MAQCRMFSICPFFRGETKNVSKVAASLKSLYCMKDYCSCALFLILLAEGKEKVPPDLLPDQMMRVAEILNLRN